MGRRIKLLVARRVGKESQNALLVGKERFQKKEGFELDSGLAASVHGERLLDALSQSQFSHLPPSIADWQFHLGEPWPAIRLHYHVLINFKGSAISSLRIELRSTYWRYPWTIEEYIEEFHRVAKMHRGIKFRRLERFWGDQEQIELDLTGLKTFVTIGSEIDRVLKFSKEIHETARTQLLIRINKSSLVTWFEFPLEHSAACKQYLIYFAEFLRMVGLRAETALTDEAQRVLFTVTPQDKTVALSRLRDALNVYLKLPDYRVSFADLTSNDPSIGRLATIIAHCQKMLGTGNEPKDISSSVVISGTAGEADKESFLGGRFSLKKLEYGPFELDLPQIVRDLKKRFPILRKLR